MTTAGNQPSVKPRVMVVPRNQEAKETPMDETVQQAAQDDQPEPTTLAEALARINTTPEDAWALAVNAKWGFGPMDGTESPYEYDQDDTLTVHYDDLYDVANIALAALKFARGVG